MFEITFSVTGYVRQRVDITDPEIDAATLRTLLSNGDAATTVQEGGEILLTKPSADGLGKIIGHVQEVDNQCEYSEFEVRC